MSKCNLFAATALAVLFGSVAFAQAPGTSPSTPRPPTSQSQQAMPETTGPQTTAPHSMGRPQAVTPNSGQAQELEDELNDPPPNQLRAVTPQSAMQPGASQPGMSQPGMPQSGTSQPMAPQPGMQSQSGVSQPATRPAQAPTMTAPGSTTTTTTTTTTTPPPGAPATTQPYGAQPYAPQPSAAPTPPAGPAYSPAPAYAPPQSYAPPSTYTPPPVPRPATASGGSSTLFGGRRDNGLDPGPYFRIDVGAGFAGDVEFDANVTGPEGSGTLPFSSNSDLDIGWLASAAIGFEEFPLPRWRTELEAVYLNNETDDSNDNFDDVFDIGDDGDDNDSASADLSVTGGFANLIYDFDFDTPFSLYLGAGAGYGQVDVEYDGASGDDEVFLWQIRAGVGYEWTDNTVLDIGYRFIDAESASFEEDGIDLDVSGEVDMAVHAITAGIRFRF